MTKILTIGDIHGRTTWKAAKKMIKDCDKVVFIGDYCDSLKIHWLDWLDNLSQIIEFKKKYPDKVILLLGNHDMTYLFDNHSFNCTGYKPEAYAATHELFVENKELFQMAYETDGVLFSHAGVSSVWLESNTNKHINTLPIADQVNELFRYTPNVFQFTLGKSFSNTGNDVTQTPIWIRPSSLAKVPAHSYQIVGHTQVDKPMGIVNGNNVIVLTDAPDYFTELGITDKVVMNKIKVK